MADQTESTNRKPNGFAAMDPEKRRLVASRGGKSAHASHRAHCFTRDEARVAGAKGGAAVSVDREYMAMIGRRGAAKRNGFVKAEREAKAAAHDVPHTATNAAQHDLPHTD